MGKYDFRYNVITNNVEISVKKKDKFTPMKEANIIEELFEEGWTAFALQFKVMVASESVAPPYNPIDNYFDNLPKYHVNGKKDYIKELLSFITLADESKRAFFEEQFTKWIARAVACARGSLKVNKQCFTLIGKQNDGKTSFFRYLVPKTLAEFYAENVNVQKNDGEFMLTQSFLINWDEMAQFSKYEVSAIKTFMTKENVRQRRPYATKAEMFRRICSSLVDATKEHIRLNISDRKSTRLNSSHRNTSRMPSSA